MKSNFFNQKWERLTQHWSLQLYGMALASTHIWTSVYWWNSSFFLNSQGSRNSEPLCFPFFAQCAEFRAMIPETVWLVVLVAYSLAAITTTTLFFIKRINPLPPLFALTLFKFALHMSNYNFMGNYHYMVYIITLCYLFLPNPERLIPWLMVAFYWAAGVLKLNMDWLSGAAMISTPWLTGQLLSISLIYVIFLELILVFGLLSSKRWIRWTTLFQFFSFHVFSWHIVGFFYPMIMFSLLSLFILQELEIYFFQKKEWHSTNTPQTHPSYLPLWGVLLIFIFLQILPFLITKDPALSGAARLPSLNMFDAKTECQSLMIAHSSKASVHLTPPLKNLGVRLGCDPLVFLNQAQEICRLNTKNKEFDRLSLHLFSKRITATDYQTVLALDDVCSHHSILWSELLASGEIQK